MIFGGRFDLAILSVPLALPGLTSGQAVSVAWLCDCPCLEVEDDLVCFLRRFCLIATIASRVSCFGQPELSGGASSWYRHSKALLNPSSGVWSSACPRVFPKSEGVDDGRPFA